MSNTASVTLQDRTRLSQVLLSRTGGFLGFCQRESQREVSVKEVLEAHVNDMKAFVEQCQQALGQYGRTLQESKAIGTQSLYGATNIAVLSPSQYPHLKGEPALLAWMIDYVNAFITTAFTNDAADVKRKAALADNKFIVKDKGQQQSARAELVDKLAAIANYFSQSVSPTGTSMNASGYIRPAKKHLNETSDYDKQVEFCLKTLQEGGKLTLAIAVPIIKTFQAFAGVAKTDKAPAIVGHGEAVLQVMYEILGVDGTTSSDEKGSEKKETKTPGKDAYNLVTGKGKTRKNEYAKHYSFGFLRNKWVLWIKFTTELSLLPKCTQFAKRFNRLQQAMSNAVDRLIGASVTEIKALNSKDNTLSLDTDTDLLYRLKAHHALIKWFGTESQNEAYKQQMDELPKITMVKGSSYRKVKVMHTTLEAQVVKDRSKFRKGLYSQPLSGLPSPATPAIRRPVSSGDGGDILPPFNT